MADPSNPGLAAAVLAVSEAVVEGHYNLVRQEHAAADYVRHVGEERQRTADPPPRRAALRRVWLKPALES